MTRLLLHCAATLLLTAFAAAQDAVTAYTNANILPGGKPAMSDATMVISGGKILAIGGADLQVPEGAKVIDCKGRTITPGLIDASFQSDAPVLQHPTEVPGAKAELSQRPPVLLTAAPVSHHESLTPEDDLPGPAARDRASI